MSWLLNYIWGKRNLVEISLSLSFFFAQLLLANTQEKLILFLKKCLILFAQVLNRLSEEGDVATHNLQLLLYARIVRTTKLLHFH